MTLKGKYQKFHHRGSRGWRCSTLTCRNYLCVQGLIIVPNRGLLSILWGRNDRRGVINRILSKPLVSAFQRPERHGSMSVDLKQALRGVYGRCVQTRCWREGVAVVKLWNDPGCGTEDVIVDRAVMLEETGKYEVTKSLSNARLDSASVSLLFVTKNRCVRTVKCV